MIDNQVVVPEKFIIQIDGKPYVLYAGLLHVAREQGLKELSTDIHQIPNADNGYMAIMRAKAVTAEGAIFVDFGDASPGSVGDDKFCLMRVASTRAKARVLRDAYIGLTAIEELPFNNLSNDNPTPPTTPSPTVAPVKSSEEPMTEKQHKVLLSLAKQLHFGREDYVKQLGGLNKSTASRKIEELSAMVKSKKLGAEPQTHTG